MCVCDSDGGDGGSGGDWMSERITATDRRLIRDYQAILNAMVAKTPIMQPMVGTSAGSTLPTGFPTAMSVPGTSSTTGAPAPGPTAPSTSATATAADQLVQQQQQPQQKVEVRTMGVVIMNGCRKYFSIGGRGARRTHVLYFHIKRLW
ncbi:unnamed protein product [Strongylus vulgaris]|uniref:Uncharacterized protein n=1 Tax=Strongylus vulgaris TaxID=40348 RepID=A0A3P7ICY0_STRVU|nr:unnamed protein product [Strongylus vulgaris]